MKLPNFDLGKRVVTLNNGVQMPIFGLGTYQMRGPQVKEALRNSLRMGYRLIDSAASYGNEEDIAEELASLTKNPSELGLSSFSRKDVFITSKLSYKDHGYSNAMSAFERSKKALNCDVIDLYLIHWPGKKFAPDAHDDSHTARRESWRALETLYKEGKVRAIGVSNYTIPHLEELLSECSVTPAVIQNEIHPFLFHKDWVDYCQSKGIQIEAYASLGEGKILNEPEVEKIAKKLKKTCAQVLLRWALQHDMIVIPKSSNADRLEENRNIFDFSLSEADMTKLDSLNANRHMCWNPENVK